MTIPCVLGCAWLTLSSAAQPGTRAVGWADLTPPARARLARAGVNGAAFPPFVERLRREHARRMKEGDLDHLVFYLLQSTHFTRDPPIEPALSAKALVDGLAAEERKAFLGDGRTSAAHVPAAVRSRIAALVRALDSSGPDARLAYFRALVDASFPDRATRSRALEREYFRAMRFLYEKEFVAQRSAGPKEAVERLYQSRGLSTDTAVEAGYLVYLGLGVMKSLDPGRRVRRVLIVGPGLDLAPRTGLLEAGPPESYQPWTVIDAPPPPAPPPLDDLQVVAADINPRVVDHLRRARSRPPVLTLVSGISERDGVRFASDYRDYFTRLGASIGRTDRATVAADGRLSKVVRVDPMAVGTLTAESLDVVTERLADARFDAVIATNILPYFDDEELMLALANIAGMLGPGGMFLHNDTRPSMRPVAEAARLTFAQSRQAIIADVRGAPPLGDAVWLYRKGGEQ